MARDRAETRLTLGVQAFSLARWRSFLKQTNEKNNQTNSSCEFYAVKGKGCNARRDNDTKKQQQLRKSGYLVLCVSTNHVGEKRRVRTNPCITNKQNTHLTSYPIVILWLEARLRAVFLENPWRRTQSK